MNPSVVELDWQPAHRLVPSRFPPVSLFDRVARAEDLEAVFAVQGMTNPRLRQEVGDISLVAPDERVSGTGSSPVMAAFCHLNAAGSRFSDGSWGVYYGANSLPVAVAEVGHHRAVFLAATSQAAIDIDMRSYVARVKQPLHDLRGKAYKSLHDPNSYVASQALAGKLRAAGSWGLVYNSVREPGGQCIAVLRPKGIRIPVVQGAHVSMHWDGSRISSWYKKSDLLSVGEASAAGPV